MNRGFKAVLAKECRHLRRDPLSLVYILLVPFVMIWLYGYGINLDVRDVRTAVVDDSRGPYADRLIGMMARSGIFVPLRIPDRAGAPPSLDTAERLMKAGFVRQVLILPEDFDENLSAGKPAEIGLLIDGSDALAASSIGRLQERLIASFSGRLDPGGRPDLVRTRIAFNPSGQSSLTIIPGLMAIVLMAISALLTSLAVARERETGAIEILSLSRLRSRDFVLGKALPYAFAALLDGALILALAVLWFHVPVRGDVAALAVFSLLYVLAGAATGLLISTAVTTQREATIAEVLTTFLPAFFLSGFILPLETLPPFLKGLSYAVPATHFIKIVRGILLKGQGFSSFIVEAAALAAYAAALLGLSVWIFSRRRAVPR